MKMFALLLFPISYSIAIDGSAVLKEMGEEKYQMLKGTLASVRRNIYNSTLPMNFIFVAKSSVSRHGTCWQNALKTMKVNCNNLNDDDHSLLALQLTHCFLEDSGHKTYDCHLSSLSSQRR